MNRAARLALLLTAFVTGSLAAPLAAHGPDRILFIGNSFTQGANSAVLPLARPHLKKLGAKREPTRLPS